MSLEFRNDIKECIHAHRPTISESSLRTYLSILSKLYTTLFHANKFDANQFEEHIEEVMSHLKQKPIPSRKTAMSALLSVLSPKSAAYNNVHNTMMELSREYKHIKNENKMDDKQRANWVTQQEIKNIYDRLTSQATQILKTKEKLTMSQLLTVQNWVILACTSGVLNLPPRRVADWIYMSNVKASHTANTNSIVFYRGSPASFIFREFKTKATLGEQEITIPSPLAAVLKKWIAVSKDVSPWLFFNAQGGQLRADEFTRKLNHIFGKKTSVNILRHSYVTNFYSNGVASLNDMQSLAEQMGQSNVETNLGYILEK